MVPGVSCRETLEVHSTFGVFQIFFLDPLAIILVGDESRLEEEAGPLRVRPNLPQKAAPASLPLLSRFLDDPLNPQRLFLRQIRIFPGQMSRQRIVHLPTKKGV
jgi:hypothetical protein